MSNDEILIGIVTSTVLPGAAAGRKTFWRATVAGKKKSTPPEQEAARCWVMGLPLDKTKKDQTIQLSLLESRAVLMDRVLHTYECAVPANLLVPLFTVGMRCTTGAAPHHTAALRVTPDAMASGLPASPWGLLATAPPQPQLLSEERARARRCEMDVRFYAPFYEGPTAVTHFTLQVSEREDFSAVLVERSIAAAPSHATATATATSDVDSSDNQSGGGGGGAEGEVGSTQQQQAAETGGESASGAGGGSTLVRTEVACPAFVGGTTYHYRVCAVNESGSSPFLNASAACPVWPPEALPLLEAFPNPMAPRQVVLRARLPLMSQCHGDRPSHVAYRITAATSGDGVLAGSSAAAFFALTGCSNTFEGRLPLPTPAAVADQEQQGEGGVPSVAVEGQETLVGAGEEQVDNQQTLEGCELGGDEHRGQEEDVTLEYEYELVPGVTYWVCAAAVNAAGVGDWCDAVPVALSPCAPLEPTALSHVPHSDGFKLSFTAHKWSGGMDRPITHVCITVMGSKDQPRSCEGEEPSAEGPSSGQGIDGQQSAEVGGCEEDSESGRGEVLLTLSVPWDDVRRASLAGDEEDGRYIVQVTGLPTNSTFEAALCLQNSVGQSPSSCATVTSQAIPPAAVTGLTQAPETTTNTHIGLQWSAPAHSGGLPVTHYSLHWRSTMALADGGEWEVLTVPSDGSCGSTGAVISALAVGCVVEAFVVAHNEIGPSQPCPTARFEALGVPPPVAPSSVHVWAVRSPHELAIVLPAYPALCGGECCPASHMRVRYWTGEGDQGGDGMVECDVALVDVAKEDEDLLQHADGHLAGLVGVLCGLPAWTTFHVQVAVANKCGVGPWSDQVATATTFPGCVEDLSETLAIPYVYWGAPYTPLPPLVPSSPQKQNTSVLCKQDAVVLCWPVPPTVDTKCAAWAVEVTWCVRGVSGAARSGRVTAPWEQGHVVVCVKTARGDEHMTRILRAASRSLELDVQVLPYWHTSSPHHFGRQEQPEEGHGTLARALLRCAFKQQGTGSPPFVNIAFRVNPEGCMAVYSKDGSGACAAQSVAEVKIMPEPWDANMSQAVPRYQSCSHPCVLLPMLSLPAPGQPLPTTCCAKCTRPALCGWSCAKCSHTVCKECACAAMCADIYPSFVVPELDDHPLTVVHDQSYGVCDGCAMAHAFTVTCVRPFCHEQVEGSRPPPNLCIHCFSKYVDGLGAAQSALVKQWRASVRTWCHFLPSHVEALTAHQADCFQNHLSLLWGLMASQQEGESVLPRAVNGMADVLPFDFGAQVDNSNFTLAFGASELPTGTFGEIGFDTPVSACNGGGDVQVVQRL